MGSEHPPRSGRRTGARTGALWRPERRAAALAARAGAGLAGGVLGGLSLPPFGFWPLAFLGLALLSGALAGQPARKRALVGAAFGLGQFTVGLWWMGEFNGAGAGAVVVLETLFLMAATVATPPGPSRAWALPATLVLAEAARGAVPWGGLPMAGVALGQVTGPLGGMARVGGQLALLALAGLAGVALAEAVGRRWKAAAAAALVVTAGLVAGPVAPDGGAAGERIDAVAVQGGGARGFRRADVDARLVFEAQLAASRRLRPPVDLVLWPEDVIDLDQPVNGTPEAAEVAEVATTAGATVVAGVIEGVGRRRFRNAAVVWSPQGAIVGRYEKVHRVPFGEYIPLRGFFGRLGDISAVPRDAIAGRGPGLLRTPAGDLGALISYEVFYADRARAATRAGARALVVPTNAASFRTSQVPAQEVAAAQLRAIESGRDLLQAAPTGYSALVDHRGRVVARSTLGRRQLITGELGLRDGRTLYTRAGDGPVLALAAAGLAGAWVTARRRPRPR